MDFLDILSEKAFLGREFLTWLWFKSDQSAGRIEIPGEKVVEVLFLEAQIVRIVSENNMGKDNLVIASANNVDDTSTWIPLVTQAHVIFSRDSHFVLPVKNAYDIYFYREALYLYMGGRDSAWVKFNLRKPRFVIFPTTLPLNVPDREKTISYVEAILLPLMSRIEAGDPDTFKLLRSYNRILVIDDADNPMFLRNNLSKYLTIIKEEIRGLSLLLWCKPL